MVHVSTMFSILAAVASFKAAAAAPLSRSATQPDCLDDTTIRCSIYDIVQNTDEGVALIQTFSSHAASLDSYSASQFIQDTDAIVTNWKRIGDVTTVAQNLNTLNILNIVANAAHVHQNLDLPLFTVFQDLSNNKTGLRVPLSVVHAQAAKISAVSDTLGEIVFTLNSVNSPQLEEMFAGWKQEAKDGFTSILTAFP